MSGLNHYVLQRIAKALSHPEAAPEAAALFEATTEAVFLVAMNEGSFTDEEYHCFKHIVAEASSQRVKGDAIDILLSELVDKLTEDGIELRASKVAKTLVHEHHRLEVLRTAALMAHIYGGVAQPERDVLHTLARHFGLDPSSVDKALIAAKAILNGT